ncbi:hypothetical protein Hanom_Chr05g00424701 [Helianthus anomalus]
MPPGYIALYAAFFREGNFRLPMMKFTAEVLTNYGLHISQINALGLPRLTHFEFICKSNRIKSTFEMFNVFYNVSYTGGFYSFNSRPSGFFYIRRGVIPVDMHYRAEGEGIPKIDVSINFVEQEWYKTLTRKATSISQAEERALVAASMSMMWVLKNPRGVPVYGYQGKVGYSLLNVLDPKAGGAMIEAILPEGRPSEDDGDDFDDTTDPTRKEVSVLSSESSDRSCECLIPRSPRAGPAQEAANEPVNEPVDVDADLPVETAEQLETQRKKKLDKSEEKEKRVEEDVTKTPRKRPSTLPFLDYVVVSDTLSSLGTKEKRIRRDPDDSAAAALAAKRAKLQKEAPPAPSESEIDLGVFTAKHGNLLDKIFVASGSHACAKPGKTSRKVDVSKITPPNSPPSRTFVLSLSPADHGKRKEDDVEIEQVGEGGVAGVAGDAGGDGRSKGVDTEAESS